MRDPLEFPCTVCSAAIGQPCHDRQFNEMAEPHTNRTRLAGGRPGSRAVAGAVGGVLGTAVGGPVGAAFGAVAAVALEPLVEGVWAEIQAEGRRRALAVVEQAAETAQVSSVEFVERMNAGEHTRLLSASAMSAATRTVYGPKIRALGRVLAAGLENDCARIDDEQLLMAALADMEAPHAILLELLVKYRPQQGLGQPVRAEPSEPDRIGHWTTDRIAHVRPALKPVLPGLLGTLQRHGLAETDSNMAKALEKYGKAVQDQARNDSSGVMGRPPTAFMLQREMPPIEWTATALGVVSHEVLDASSS